MGRTLRIYGADTESNLDLLRLIRNAFAHAHVPISFEMKQVASAVNLFRDVSLRPPFNVGVDVKPVPLTAREKFHHHCEILTHNLIVWGRTAFQL